MQIIARSADVKPLDEVVVFYHGGQCRDGFCAAWLFAMAMCQNAEGLQVPVIGNSIVRAVIPIQHTIAADDEALIAARKKHVIFVDVVPRCEVLKAVAEWAESITILDHHATAVSELCRLLNCELPAGIGSISFSGHVETSLGDGRCPVHVVFDTSRSGAMLALTYLTMERGFVFNHDVRRLVEFVQDRDLWRCQKGSESHTFNAYLRSIPLEFDEWSRVWRLMVKKEEFSKMLVAGDAILKSHAEIVQQHVRNAREMLFDGHRVWIVNATVATLASEIGEAILQTYPDAEFSVTFFDTTGPSAIRQYQLRSRTFGVHVGNFAARHGGGGHPGAAGFRIALKDVETIERPPVVSGTGGSDSCETSSS